MVFVAVICNIAHAAPVKKVVFLAGTKSHGPGEHEYEKGMRLLAKCLETSPNLHGFKTEVHLYGWPEDPKTLNDADAIVVYCDGSDHNEADHPLLIGDRLVTLGRQMKRGAGLVLLHYATFAAVKHGGPEYLDWVGGYFDYETGSGPNHWRSAIQFAKSTPTPATLGHPITRGIQPFELSDEYYYKMRFADGDSRRKPILNVNLPNEPETQTVAWAVERADGGRGFAFTGGHPYSNFRNDSFRKVMLNAIAWAAKADVPANGVESTVQDGVDEIHALILTGRHHPAHDWRATTPAIQQLLGRDSRIRCDVWEDPERLAREDLSRYDLIIQNYCNWESPSLSEPSRKKLLDFVRGGRGLMLIHFANGAWRDWPEYFGRMARRVWVDGKANHDAFGPFHVTVADRNTRFTAGLPDFDTTDELYCSQVGDLPVSPLLIANSKTTGRDEPLAFAYSEGKGRVFQTLLGHSVEGLTAPVHAELLRRAAAWCANREILPVGANNPPARPGGADKRPLAGYSPVRDARPAEPRSGDIIVPGKFGKALNATGRQVTAGKPAAFEPPMTVELWAKLNSRTAFNILIANHLKESARHWEVYTTAGSGTLAAYLPASKPDVIDSGVNVADGQWHYLAFQWHKNRAILFVDGKRVKDVPLAAGHVDGADAGPLWFGCYPLQGLGCDGLIDEVRISNYARDIESIPTSAPVLDRDTLGLWRFDTADGMQLVDESPRRNAAMIGGPGALTTRVAARYDLKPAAQPLPLVRKPNSVDWPNVANDKGGTRYSALKQIDRTNVHLLQPAWEYHTGDANPKGNTTIECTPIVADGMMFVTTVKVNVVALDPETGRELWRFDPHAGGVNRGVAYWSDGRPDGARRVVVALSDGYMYCLDARTGRPDPGFGEGGILDLRKGLDRDISRFGYGASSAPAIFEDLVIVGFISSEVGPGAPGDVRAFDVRTGREAWRFHTVPRPGELGYETWPPNAWVDRGGANAWAGYTVDLKNGIVFAGTGSAASDFYGRDRIGDDLFANCTLALDARTGKRLWHFQTVHHDLWDHDNPCPPTMVTVKRNGRSVEAVAQPTKTGYVFLFDRKTGDPLFPIVEKPVPASDVEGEVAARTQPVPVKPPPLTKTRFTDADVTDRTPEAHDFVMNKLKGYRHGEEFMPPSRGGSVITPGFHGGSTWGGAAFDPATNVLYTNTNNVPYISTLVPDATFGYNFTGYNYFRDQEGFPAGKPPWGLLTAIDLNKGTFLWQIPFGEYPKLVERGYRNTGTENFGGAVVTAGGLVFIAATADAKMHAYDKATGKLLWEFQLPAGGYASPSTYMVNGRQYVVIACGGGGKLNTTPGDSYIAFALPQSLGGPPRDPMHTKIRTLSSLTLEAILW